MIRKYIGHANRADLLRETPACLVVCCSTKIKTRGEQRLHSPIVGIAVPPAVVVGYAVRSGVQDVVVSA